MKTLTVPEYIIWKSDIQDITISEHAVYLAMRDGRLDSEKIDGLKCILMNTKAFDYIPQQREPKLKKDSDGMVMMPNGVLFRDEEWWKGQGEVNYR